MNKILLSAALLAVAASASAADRQFSYPAEGAKLQYFGNSKAETYDVAIRIADPTFVGKQVTAVSVVLCEGAGATDPKGWLSSELLLDSKKKNAPDIATVSATISDDNVLTATFSEPYTMTAAGVYVGYSITIPSKPLTFGAQNPNPVATCSSPDGMYIHSTRTNLKWSSLAQYGVASTMEVTLSGEFGDPAVGVVSVAKVRTEEGSSSVVVPVTVANYGSQAVNSMELTYKYGDSEAATVSADLATPVSAKFGTQQTVEVALPAYATSTTLTVAVSKVNGVVNTLADASASAPFTVMTFVPELRPLMEEYTGLWCGWCPRGWVAMEEMTEAYPQDFVCVSYHSNGSSNPYGGGELLQYVADFPNNPNGFPTAFFNRSLNIDPYYGAGDDPMGVRDLWLQLRQEECPANVSTELSWADAEHTRLVCRSTTKFIEDVAGSDYRVCYVITGNGFRTVYAYNADGSINVEESTILIQSNYYSGREAEDDSPLWAQFVNGASSVVDVVYNDVAMAISGNQEAFEGALKANTDYSHEFEFDYGKITNLDPKNPANILPADGKLRCVAVLLTADGKFVNSNKSELIETTSVADAMVDSNAAVIGTEWYDLQGRKAVNPANGMYIRLDRMSDGTARRTKTFVK